MKKYFLLKQGDLEYRISEEDLEFKESLDKTPAFEPFVYIDVFVNSKNGQVERAKEEDIGKIIKKINKNQSGKNTTVLPK